MRAVFNLSLGAVNRAANEVAQQAGEVWSELFDDCGHVIPGCLVAIEGEPLAVMALIGRLAEKGDAGLVSATV